jgi:hypothetical protein
VYIFDGGGGQGVMGVRFLYIERYEYEHGKISEIILQNAEMRKRMEIQKYIFFFLTILSHILKVENYK